MKKYDPSTLRPEAKIQRDITHMLKAKDWFVKSTHGNAYQSGFPDLYCTHSLYGYRWVEVKLPNMKGSMFTAAQLDIFPKMMAHGAGIWILWAATEEQYRLLFEEANFPRIRLQKALK